MSPLAIIFGLYVMFILLLGAGAFWMINRPRPSRYQGSKNLVFSQGEDGVWKDDPTKHWAS